MKNTIKLAGIMLISIIVLGCSPKKSAEAEAQAAAEKMAQAAALEAQAQTENIAPSNTSGGDFFFGIETGNGPEYPQFVVDSGGNSFTFHRNKQLKDIHLISIGMTEDNKLYEDNVYAYALEETGFYTNIGFYEEGKRYGENVFTSVPNEIGSFFVMVSVSEGMPTRGIAFTDENGKRKYFYISMSGMDGSPSLNEFQNTAKPQTSSAKFQMDGTRLVLYNGNEAHVTIPSSVTEIGYESFAYHDSLTSVTIPSSVMTIGDAAFRYCKSLTSVDIPSSVTTIGYFAFFNCASLMSVTISHGTYLEENAFPLNVQINYRD
jgi:hypothetical protein